MKVRFRHNEKKVLGLIYETASEVAKRMGVTVRTVQLWAKQGKLDAMKQGRDWLFPKEDFSPVTRKRLLPLFALLDPAPNEKNILHADLSEDERALMLAHLSYTKGECQKACALLEPYLSHQDPLLKIPAVLSYALSCVALGKPQVAKYTLLSIKTDLEHHIRGNLPDEERAIFLCAGFAVVTIFRMEPQKEDLKDFMRFLPLGLQSFGFYLLAQDAYNNGFFGKAYGIAEAALSLSDETHVIPFIHLHLIAAASLMQKKEIALAEEHFRTAWEKARPYSLIEPFIELYTFLHGLSERILKREYPKEYRQIADQARVFRQSWRMIHHIDYKKESAYHLSSVEYTIALLVLEGWSNTEISQYLDLSTHTIKHYLSIIYQKLGISSRKELQEHL